HGEQVGVDLAEGDLDRVPEERRLGGHVHAPLPRRVRDVDLLTLVHVRRVGDGDEALGHHLTGLAVHGASAGVQAGEPCHPTLDKRDALGNHQSVSSAFFTASTISALVFSSVTSTPLACAYASQSAFESACEGRLVSESALAFS